MSCKFEDHIGNWIKITCKQISCYGRIELIDEYKIVFSNCVINGEQSCTKYVGIDHSLIYHIEYINVPSNHVSADDVEVSNTVVFNVYSSNAQPPVIRKGGSASAVSRNLNRQYSTSQEKLMKDKNTSFIELKPRSRKSSSANGSVPSWMDYTIYDDFDFDSNLKLFDKQAFYADSDYRKNRTESSDSSDSIRKGKCQIPYQKKERSSTFHFDSDDFSSHDDKIKCFSDFERKSHSFINGISADSLSIDKRRDILSEFKEIGIIPSSSSSPNFRDVPSKSKCDQQTQISHTLVYPENFLPKYAHQPDLVQEAARSCIPKEMTSLTRNSSNSVIKIIRPNLDFNEFTDFWKLENGFKFPVFSCQQRDMLFNMSKTNGYNDDHILSTVGKTISDFVIKQVGGPSRLNKSKNDQIPKIGVLLGKCETSIYVAFIARQLLNRGCYVLAYLDETASRNISNSLSKEISLLKEKLHSVCKCQGFNYFTYDFEDLENKTFDYIITGVESDSEPHTPDTQLMEWCLNQKSHILCVNPPMSSHLAWKSAIFIGVPTCSFHKLQVRCRLSNGIGFFKPREDGVPGLGIERIFKRPDGHILLCNLSIPVSAYSFFCLQFLSSPFENRDWIRLYRENDMCSVE